MEQVIFYLRRMGAAAAEVTALMEANELPAAVRALSGVTDVVLLSRVVLRQPWCTASSQGLLRTNIFAKLTPQERRYLVSWPESPCPTIRVQCLDSDSGHLACFMFHVGYDCLPLAARSVPCISSS